MTLDTLSSNLICGFAAWAMVGGIGLAGELSLVPLPKQVVEHADQAGFALKASTTITCASVAEKPAAELLAIALREASGLAIPVVQGNKQPGAIHFSTLPAGARESYKLTVTAEGVSIQAPGNGGLVYGGQTFLQLLPQDGNKTLPAVEIADEPVFPWRGMMLDVSRYFFTKEYVIRYLDMMAMHKLNVLHWHLVDDCGWRIEIRKYPKLTEVGAFRGKGDQRHGGFYTQQDVREIIAYAAARNIEVVPEIEVPAHTLSALAAYPLLGCTGQQFEVPVKHSISPEIYCVGKETTWTFLENVMIEVAELFPSPWIHIGGDEARFDRWKKCPDCQKVIKDNGLKSELALQGWATMRLEKFLATKKKRILAWSEVLEAGVDNQVGLMVWHKPEETKTGAEAGHPIVSSQVRQTYFDTPESKLPGEPPAATWTPPVSLQIAYDWDPVPNGVSPAAVKNILGPNGCLWSDRFLHNANELADKPGQGTVKSEAYVDYLSLPRMAALAEVGWTPKSQRKYGSFLKRMERQYPRYIKAGYHFRVPTPLVSTSTTRGVTQVSAHSPVAGGSVHYTLDGSAPGAGSPMIVSPVTVGRGQVFKALTILPDGKTTSLVHVEAQTENRFAKFGETIGEWKAGQPGHGKPVEMTFDATGLIDANGEYLITFQYTGGEQRLEIDGITIVRNDAEVVANDTHHGITGSSNSNNEYRVKITDYQTGASFKVKAMVYGDTGNQSNGLVLIRKAAK